MLGNHWRRTYIELPFDRHFWQLNWIKENKNPCGSCRNLQRNFTSGNQWKTISSDINYINCIGTDTILVFSKYLYHQYSATSMHLYKHLMQKGAKKVMKLSSWSTSAAYEEFMTFCIDHPRCRIVTQNIDNLSLSHIFLDSLSFSRNLYFAADSSIYTHIICN